MTVRFDVDDRIEDFPVRRPIIAVLALYFVAVAVRIGVGGAGDHDTAVYWIGSSAAFVLMAAAVVLVTRSMSLEISDRRALTVVATTVAATAVTWATVVVDSSTQLADHMALFATATVVMVLLILRGRLLLAWLVVVGDVTVGLVLGVFSGATDWLSAVFPRASFTILFVASCTALLLGPHMVEMRGLAARRRADARGVRSSDQDVADRDERIRRIDQRVRPLLDKVVAGDEITEDDVITARLKEARLRDGIRGRALDVTRVRTAVWAARRRGVAVTVLDDGGLMSLEHDEAEAVIDAAARTLESELAGLGYGEVVARIAPPGRDPIATVTVASGAVRRRIELSADGRVQRVVEM